MSAQRVKFTYDDARFEECNGESRPLTETEYAENAYRACPDHPRAGSRVLDTSVSPNIVVCRQCGRDAQSWEDIPYAEYLAYYGNPDRHVYLCYVVEEQCKACSEWHHVDSLCGIDLMDNDRDYLAASLDQWMTVRDALQLPGYLGDLIREIQP